MNISGIIVHADPKKLENVRTQLESIPGVEIHAATELGKLVVTLDKADDRETTDTYEQISRLPGVLSTAMVYHHFEPEENTPAAQIG
ncbi:MAG: chaperone NapD [Sulfuricella sp.]|nr:chaperone NapD [Sulfuricella sp.]